MDIKTHLENLKNYSLYQKLQNATSEFLEAKGYMKIDTPLLAPALIPESHLQVFETEFKSFDKKERLYLIPAQELYLKRLIVNGIGDCYSLSHVFRNSEHASSVHMIEFTMLEYYRLHKGYLEMADEMLELLQKVLVHTTGSDTINYQGVVVDFSRWERMSVAEAFEKYAKIPGKSIFNHEQFLQTAKAKGYSIGKSNYHEVFSQIYSQEVEPFLGMNGHPTLLIDYPKEFAATAKLNPDGVSAQRFDIYITGIEVGNCYSELTDWKECEKRFSERQVNYSVDKGFIEALKYGLTDCSGATIGMDRLGMICADVKSINDLRLITIT